VAKLTVEFNDQLNKTIEQLAKDQGVTKTDILRRAVALYDFVRKETGQGGTKKLSITKDGKPVTDIVLP
jgi:predicted transcriptional regulator